MNLRDLTLFLILVYCINITCSLDNKWKKSTRRSPKFNIGCKFTIGKHCPDPDVTFFLFTRKHPEEPEKISLNNTTSNITTSAFNPSQRTKIVIHGYNSDIYLDSLQEIRKQYLTAGNYNVFFVNWFPLGRSPCYPVAVLNINHVGKCAAQLIERIRDLNSTVDIHVIGFSLGAHVPNYIANVLKPYKLARITGLDPAMPGFITTPSTWKLDRDDAEFVDVIHTNAFMQGTFEISGHADFFVNGGMIQPGCWDESIPTTKFNVIYFASIPDFLQCSHNRAPLYFAESINSERGFWGWPCASYFDYVLGKCPLREPQIEMGDRTRSSVSHGVHLVITDSQSPFAVGRFTESSSQNISTKSEEYRLRLITMYKKEISSFVEEDDLAESFYPHDFS